MARACSSLVPTNRISTRSDIYLASESGAPARLTDQAGHKANVVVGASGTGLTYSVAQTTPFRLLGGGQAAGPDKRRRGCWPWWRTGRRSRSGPGTDRWRAAWRCCACGRGRSQRAGWPESMRRRWPWRRRRPDVRRRRPRGEDDAHVTGSGATISADGSTIAWLNRNGDVCELTTAAVAGAGAPKVVRERAPHRRARPLARRHAGRLPADDHTRLGDLRHRSGRHALGG